MAFVSVGLENFEYKTARWELMERLLGKKIALMGPKNQSLEAKMQFLTLMLLSLSGCNQLETRKSQIFSIWPSDQVHSEMTTQQ